MRIIFIAYFSVALNDRNYLKKGRREFKCGNELISQILVLIAQRLQLLVACSSHTERGSFQVPGVNFFLYLFGRFTFMAVESRNTKIQIPNSFCLFCHYFIQRQVFAHVSN